MNKQLQLLLLIIALKVRAFFPLAAAYAPFAINNVQSHRISSRTSGGRRKEEEAIKSAERVGDTIKKLSNPAHPQPSNETV